MPWPNQLIDPKLVGRTEAERDAILERYYEHRVTNYKSSTSFPDLAYMTIRRLSDDHSDFKERKESIDRLAMEAMEEVLKQKMLDDEKPINLRAWELLTRHRIEFREPKEEIAPAPSKIEIVYIDSRTKKEEYEKQIKEDK